MFCCKIYQNQPQLPLDEGFAYVKIPLRAGSIKAQIKQSITYAEIKDPNFEVVKFKLSKSKPDLIALQKAGAKFQDVQFQAGVNSLGNFDGKESKISWSRISQIYKSAVLFDQKGVLPQDILQGDLGDCYFLSAITSIAEIPFRIQKLFLPSCNLELGYFSVLVYNKGVPTQVIVDDFVPTVKGKPLFAQVNPCNNQIWVLILEKVWAKLNGNYKNITGGYPHTVLQTFSGCPTILISFDQQEEEEQLNIQNLQWASQQNFPCCAGSRQSACNGLIPSHAYSLITMAYFEQTKQRVVKLRNPWGKIQWNGKYNDKDPLWKKISTKTKSVIKFSDSNDGFFFMSLKDFMMHFLTVDICCVVPGFNYDYSSFQLGLKKSLYLQVVVEEDGNYFFTMNVNISQQNPSRLILILASYDGKKVQFLDGSIEQTFKTVTVVAQLKKGSNILYCKVDGQKFYKDIVISSYSNCGKVIKVFDKNKLRDSLGNNRFFQNLFLSRAIAPQPRNHFDINQKFTISSELMLKETGFGYFMVHVNDVPGMQVQVEFDSQEFSKRGLRLKKPWKNHITTRMNLKSGDVMMVICRLVKHLNEEIAFPPPIKVLSAI